LDTSVPAAEHWDGTKWSFVPVPNPDAGTHFGAVLGGVAPIASNDIWAVGTFQVAGGASKTLTEHWDGTSWSIIPSPDPGRLSNSLSGVTALSDGTVAAVGQQVSSKVETGLILMNAASAPKKATTASAPATSGLPMLDAVPPTKAEATTTASTAPAPVPMDAASLDQFFAAIGQAGQRLLFAARRSAAHELAANDDLDVMAMEM
jgi:hypothetical protein